MGFSGYISEIIYNDGLKADSYLNELPLIKHLKRENRIKLSSDITFFIGENGTGKSTLLEALAVSFGFNAEGGSRNFNFSTNATHSELHEHLTLGKKAYPKDGFFLRAESVYNVATNLEELDRIPAAAPKLTGGYGGKSLHHQSHGESFLSIVKNRFFGQGLYILDEPEAALSPNRLLSLMLEIKRLRDKNSQFIIATHSPILMTFPGAEIFEFSENGLSKTDYKSTDHYNITRRFLEDPERMLGYLFEAE